MSVNLKNKIKKKIIKFLSYFILDSKKRKAFRAKFEKTANPIQWQIDMDKKYQKMYNMGFASYANIEFNVANPKYTTIGKYCSIANEVCLGLTQHPIDCLTTHGFIVNRKKPRFEGLLDVNDNVVDFPEQTKVKPPITVGNDVWIGCRAIIMDGVSIGDGAIVAAGAIVTKDVEPYTIVGGVPAKPIGKRFSGLREGGYMLKTA